MQIKKEVNMWRNTSIVLSRWMVPLLMCLFQSSFIQFQISKQRLQMENVISEDKQPRENVHVMMNQIGYCVKLNCFFKVEYNKSY
jgi:hypothetical protein